MPDVRSMCAIGLSGQLGLNGHLPWEGNKGREYKEDVENSSASRAGTCCWRGRARRAPCPNTSAST